MSKRDIRVSGLLNEIYPENKKLNALDEKEAKLRQALEHGDITFAEYDRMQTTIDLEKQALILRLEKKGYFSETEETDNVESDQSNNLTPPVTIQEQSYETLRSTLKTAAAMTIEVFAVLLEIFKFFLKGTIQLILMFFTLMAILMK